MMEKIIKRFAVLLILFFWAFSTSAIAGSGLTVWEKFTTDEIAGDDLIGMTDVSDSGGTSKAGTVTQLVDYLSTFFGEGGTGTFDPSADITFLGNIDLSQAASVLFGPIYLNEPAADGTSYVSFSVPALAANRAVTFGDYAMQIPLETGVDSDGRINESGLATGAFTTTKVVTGAIATSTDSDAHTFTPAEIHGGTVLATGAGIYGPLTAAAGISGCVQKGQGATGIIQLLPASGDYIVKDGVRGTVATSIKSSTGLGEWICFKCVDSTDIYVEVKGAWAE